MSDPLLPAPPPRAPRPLDLEALASIVRDPDGINGHLVVVQRSWLSKVERELREGRAAMALLSAQRAVTTACAQIGSQA